MSDAAIQFLIDHALHGLVGGFLVWFLWKAVRMMVRPGAEDLGTEDTGELELHPGEGTRQ